MPLVRIDVIEGRSDTELAALGAAVHHALTTCFGVPDRDRFQLFTEHRRGRLVYDPAYLGVERTDAIVVVQVFFSTGRSAEQKQAFYALVADGIAQRTATRPDDVFISLVENTRADWSFGNGVAQYLTMPRETWR
jgi:phenylpyruvate tautomerase PptA (4-oxalocrotonate tautomerase family)